jgi:hypothetical protein
MSRRASSHKKNDKKELSGMPLPRSPTRRPAAASAAPPRGGVTDPVATEFGELNGGRGFVAPSES